MSKGPSANSHELVTATTRSRLISRLRLTAVLTGLVGLLCSASPAVASAHLRSGTVAVDYRATLWSQDPSAYSAQIFQSDRALSVTVKPGHAVTLLGYLSEPVFRLDSAGLWVNAASPTAVVFRFVKKSERILASTPHWRLERGQHSAAWQDARAQGLPPDASQGTWSVPLLVDGRRSRLEGELERFPAPSLWTWAGVLAGLLAAGLTPMLLHRRELAGRAAIAFALPAAAASIVILIAFALDAYASPGTWIEAVDVITFLGVGVWVLLRMPEQWHVAAAIGLGLVALAVALLELPIFIHPIVLAILPATATRIADIVTMGAGLNAIALGGLFYLETAPQLRGDKPELGPATQPGDQDRGPGWSGSGRERV